MYVYPCDWKGIIPVLFFDISMFDNPCDGNSDEFIVATYDTKVKERAALMNPTGR